METSKVKAQFFAMYYKQKVLHVSDGARVCQEIDGYFIDRFIDTGYLLLRSIEQLADEEIKQVADVCDFVPLDEMVVERNDMFIKVYSKYNEHPHYNHVAIYLSGEMFSYVDSKVHTMDNERCDIMWQLLRAYGVLTSFTFINEQGKPETYSPEKIIELGWAKTNQHQTLEK